MGVFRRRAGKGSASSSDVVVGTSNNAEERQGLTDVDLEVQEKAQEVMKDNLELMREVVMKIRDDPEFAKNIYANCPRLQHLLDQYPDLRPIFEDPKLVRINFEQVYRDAGGVLPEDEEKKPSWIVRIVNSPCFKILKLLLFVKKLVACILGGGFAAISGCVMGCCFEDAIEEIDAPEEVDSQMDPTKEALNRAADHMEDPEVQERMQALLEDPDNLQEAIENDDELRALRDSNPLCEELMSDPETMRVLTDPDNLRALGECPQLIEADFIDPDGFNPADIEGGGYEDGLGETGYDNFDGGDMEFEADNDYEVDYDFEEAEGGEDDFEVEGEQEEAEAGEEGEEEEEGGWWEDAEVEEQDVDTDNNGPDNGGTDSANNNGNDSGNQAAAQGKGQARAQQQRSTGEQDGNQPNSRFGGIIASIGAAATDLVAGQIVGGLFNAEMLTGGAAMLGGAGAFGAGVSDLVGGGDSDLHGLDVMADVAGGGGGESDNLLDMGGDVIDDDAAAAIEETKDRADEKDGDEEGKDDDDNKNSKSDLLVDSDDGKHDTKRSGNSGDFSAALGVSAGAGAAVGGATTANMGTSRSRKGSEGLQDSFADEVIEEDKPKSSTRLFGAVGKFAQTLKTHAKEHIASSLLGDAWGEDLVARMEEGGGDKKGEKDNNNNSNPNVIAEEDEEGEDDQSTNKKRGFFRRGNRKNE